MRRNHNWTEMQELGFVARWLTCHVVLQPVTFCSEHNLFYHKISACIQVHFSLHVKFVMFPLVARRSYNNTYRNSVHYHTVFQSQVCYTPDNCSLWALSVTRHTSRPTLVASLPLADRLGWFHSNVIFVVGLLLLVVLFVKFAEALGRCRSKEKLTLLLLPPPPTGHALAHLVEALRFKPEGHGFDSRWCHWNFSVA